ncbi:sugar phosphate isomerase/epimerase family protein [Pseudochryseolinea flava]|nr:sugar phosphate isomerase/epimerase family protein [Pseudochryseolinea flava]
MNTLLTLFFVVMFEITTLMATAQTHTLGLIAQPQYDSLLYASGFRLTGRTVESLLGPKVSNAEFQAHVKSLHQLKCNVYVCNVLFPGSIKIAGPDVDQHEVLSYLEAVLVRAQHAGIKNLTLGSGGARRLPPGYDATIAKTRFIELSKQMAALAKKYAVTIILENLNSTETNFINTLRDATDIVKRVDHPNFRLNADIYHMLKERELPEAIENAKGLIVYCEIAESQKRSLPGVHGEDFRPYFAALKNIGYEGPIMIEGNVDNLTKDAPIAFRYLQSQLREVWEKK